jgi:hypothetical protein
MVFDITRADIKTFLKVHQVIDFHQFTYKVKDRFPPDMNEKLPIKMLTTFKISPEEAEKLCIDSLDAVKPQMPEDN